MSAKGNNRMTTTTTSSAESQNVLPIETGNEPTTNTKPKQVIDLTDANAFLTNMKIAPVDLMKSRLKMKPAYAEKFKVYMLPDEKYRQHQSTYATMHILPVVRGGSVFGIPVSDIVEDSSFVVNGEVKTRVWSEFTQLNKVTNTHEPEQTVYLQPIGAYDAWTSIMRKAVNDKLNSAKRDRVAAAKDELARVAVNSGLPKGAVEIPEFHDGDYDESDSAWNG